MRIWVPQHVWSGALSVTNQLSFNISFPKFDFETSMEFKEGLHVIYGESGSGKSGFIRQLTDSKNRNENFIISSINGNEKIQKVFQNPDTQIVSSTIKGELAFSIECHENDQKMIEYKCNEIEKDMFFECDLSRHPATLSGGEKEMLNILTAFSISPRIVMVDDGLSFLNKDKKEEVVSYINEKIRNEKCIVLWMTSDCNDMKYGDTAWELSLNSLTPWNSEKPSLKKSVFSRNENLLEIQFSNVSFDYDASNKIISNFDHTFSDFRALGITGSNGSGKTTLAKMLLEMESPHKGDVSFSIKGKNITAAYLEQFPEKMMGSDSLNDLVQRLLDAEKLDPLKVNHAIRNLQHFQIDWEWIKNKNALELPWSTLRLALTIWLSNCEYDLLVLDEPTFGLGREQVLNLSRHLRLITNNTYLLIISHDTDFIYTFCDCVFDLDQNTFSSIKETIKTNE